MSEEILQAIPKNCILINIFNDLLLDSLQYLRENLHRRKFLSWLFFFFLYLCSNFIELGTSIYNGAFFKIHWKTWRFFYFSYLDKTYWVLLRNCCCQTPRISHFPKKAKLGTLIGFRPKHDNIRIEQNNKQTKVTNWEESDDM